MLKAKKFDRELYQELAHPPRPMYGEITAFGIQKYTTHFCTARTSRLPRSSQRSGTGIPCRTRVSMSKSNGQLSKIPVPQIVIKEVPFRAWMPPLRLLREDCIHARWPTSWSACKTHGSCCSSNITSAHNLYGKTKNPIDKRFRDLCQDACYDTTAPPSLASTGFHLPANPHPRKDRSNIIKFFTHLLPCLANGIKPDLKTHEILQIYAPAAVGPAQPGVVGKGTPQECLPVTQDHHVSFAKL